MQPDEPVVRLLYVPPAHAPHTLVPVVSALNVPTPHAVQADDGEAAASVAYVPTPQPVQAVAAVRAEYEPAAQAPQREVPVVSELNLPTAHAVHGAEVVAAATLPYAPAAQAVHAELANVAA